MTDLLNEIYRRMKYLDRYLPQGRRVPVTNEERAQKIMELQEQFFPKQDYERNVGRGNCSHEMEAIFFQAQG